MIYEVIQKWDGYEVRKRKGFKTLYLTSVYRVEYSWCEDYTYSKKFKNKATAEKHIKKLEGKRVKVVLELPKEIVDNKMYTEYFGCMSRKLNELIQNAEVIR